MGGGAAEGVGGCAGQEVDRHRGGRGCVQGVDGEALVADGVLNLGVGVGVSAEFGDAGCRSGVQDQRDGANHESGQREGSSPGASSDREVDDDGCGAAGVFDMSSAHAAVQIADWRMPRVRLRCSARVTLPGSSAMGRHRVSLLARALSAGEVSPPCGRWAVQYVWSRW